MGLGVPIGLGVPMGFYGVGGPYRVGGVSMGLGLWGPHPTPQTVSPIGDECHAGAVLGSGAWGSHQTPPLQPPPPGPSIRPINPPHIPHGPMDREPHRG